jgi:hypothetical protein
MKRFFLLGTVLLALMSLGFGQNGQGQNGNGQGQNGQGQNGGHTSMPEGWVMELPLAVGGAGLWSWLRYRSNRRSAVKS